MDLAERPMPLLYLVRHAKAHPIAESDRERELMAQGCEEAAKLGALFDDHWAQPDQIICSNATRTKQTLQAMEQAGLRCDNVQIDDGLYNASAGYLLQEIARNSAESLMVIGHNPAMAILLYKLADSEDVAPDLMHFPTATIAKLTVEGADFSALQQNKSASLLSLLKGANL